MAFETPITIKEAVENIHARKYLLPAIQREFVWSTEQIEVLFDSLMRDYPIGSFLFWFVDRKNTGDYEFYEFIRSYSEFDSRHNPKADINGNDDIITVLDGQQRLTALYIGLKGTYAYKIARKRYDNPQAYPSRRLYLNLRNNKPKQDNREFDFQFLTEDEARLHDEDNYWFEVGKILNFEEYEVNNYLIENEVMSNSTKEKALFANKTLFKLHTIVHKNPVINYYLEKSTELDKVLNVFIRINNGGTKLNYTDLLLSIATAQWRYKDARQEINNFVDEINKIGDGFDFDKDVILKACLVLADVPNIAFKVDNFKKDTMLLIEQKWDEITQAIRLAVQLLSSFGYNRETLTSHNSVIPIAYYLLKYDLPNNFDIASKYEANRLLIKRWLTRSLLKKVFGAHPENVYRAIREVIGAGKTNELFPLDKIVDKFKGGEKTIVFDEDDIDNLLIYQYGQPYTFSALTVLYPTLDFRHKFHIDHIYPKSLFNKKRLLENGVDPTKVEYYLENYNSLANLQIMEGIPNQEKYNTDFKEWILKTYPDDQKRNEYMERNYIPQNIELDITNFEQFIKERSKLIKSKYTSLI